MEDLVFNVLANDGCGYNKLGDMNKISFQMLLLFLTIATERYEWKGLPKEIKPYQLEKILNLFGQAVLFKVGNSYVVTQAVNSSTLNVYGEPMEVQPVALNGKSFPRVRVYDDIVEVNGKLEVAKRDGVLIKNNMFSLPTYALIKPLVDRLCFIWESAGINAGLSRVIALVHCNKDISGVVKSEIGKIMGGTRNGLAVISDKSNVLDKIEKLDLKVDYTPSEYWEDFDNTFNLICEIVGITTDMNKAKKERVLTAQVESNDELTSVVAKGYIGFRKLSCEDANELFGLSLSVEEYEDIKSTKPTDNYQMKSTSEENNTPTLK